MNHDAHWQLFLDDQVIARSTGLDRVIHHPRARGVVIPADKPWETCGVNPLYVGRRGDGTFIAFYSAMWWDIDRAQTIERENFRRDRPHQVFSGIAYATSKDGIHWHKPNLGLADAPAGVDLTRHAPFPSPVGTTRENNLGVPFVILADLVTHGNVKDPSRRFALRVAASYGGSFDVASQEMPNEPRGYFAAEIPDFLHDPEWRSKLIDSGGDFNPRRHSVHFWDEQHEEWVTLDQGVVPHWLPSREIARFASKDLVHWTSDSILYPDAHDPHDVEHYEEPMMMLPYCTDGVIIGLCGWFHSDRSTLEGGPNMSISEQHPYIWPWARRGTCDIRVMISRDGGRTWGRTSSRQAWIPHGTEPICPDRVLAWCLPPVRVGDEDWFYVYACDQDHLNTRNNPQQDTFHRSGSSVRNILLYTQRRNRFVSLSARARGEVLITKPVEVDGDELQLNVDADRGFVKVGIAPGGAVPTFDGTTPSSAAHLKIQHQLPGLTFDDCETVHADSIEHTVRFKGASSLDPLRGKWVCLLFQMCDADLYGFRFA